MLKIPNLVIKIPLKVVPIPKYSSLLIDKSKTNLFADLIHPDIDGHIGISRNLVEMIKKYLQK